MQQQRAMHADLIDSPVSHAYTSILETNSYHLYHNNYMSCISALKYKYNNYNNIIVIGNTITST